MSRPNAQRTDVRIDHAQSAECQSQQLRSLDLQGLPFVHLMFVEFDRFFSSGILACDVRHVG